MKSLILIHGDGSRQFAGLVPYEFDTRAWIAEQREALEVFGVINVIEQYLLPPETVTVH